MQVTRPAAAAACAIAQVGIHTRTHAPSMQTAPGTLSSGHPETLKHQTTHQNTHTHAHTVTQPRTPPALPTNRTLPCTPAPQTTTPSPTLYVGQKPVVSTVTFISMPPDSPLRSRHSAARTKGSEARRTARQPSGVQLSRLWLDGCRLSAPEAPTGPLCHYLPPALLTLERLLPLLGHLEVVHHALHLRCDGAKPHKV